MKTFIYLFLSLVLLSCGNKKGDTAGQENGEAVVEENHHDKILLNDTQLASAGVEVASIAKRNIRERIHVTGTIEVPPQSKATVYAPLEAFVHQTDLLPGDKVVKGQTVATLQHPNFIQLQYSYLEAINQRDVKKADYDRKKMLLENDIASKKSFQIAEGGYKSAQSLVESYSSQLKMAGLNPASIRANGIQQYIFIKTPISGFVVENNLNQGKFLAANEEMLEIIDTDHMHAELKVFGTDISKVTKGTDFVFTPSGIDAEYDGYIKLVGQAVNEGDKTVNVHGHFEDEKGLLKAGTFINAQILTSSKEVFAIPEEAIIEREGEHYVFITHGDKEFIPVEVSLGNDDSGFVELKSMVNYNFDERIVVKGAHFLKGKWMELSGEMEGHGH
ncbi:efflux RND transporter periplasmic adaptor subunit [Spongiimicrobium sp. 3-5]|uniref:efflux RND transporter periplasmic adaptor subunit n=1 Tax=Spongiimicrobium sp. 3-5 TaxID=3332596 RepID=UPI00397F9A3B